MTGDGSSALDGAMTAFAAQNPEPAAQPAPAPTQGAPAPQPPAQQPPAPAPVTPPVTPPVRTPQEIFGQNGPIANGAFANMRAQNTRYKEVLGRLGTMIGVEDTSNPENLATALEGRIREYQATQTNVPKELLARVDQMDAFFQQYQREQLHSAALIGFQKVKEAYSLSDADLSDFAAQLDSAGMNPFVNAVDLMREYKNFNYDKLMQAAVDKAVKEALGIQQSSAASSTTPGKVTTPAQASPQKTTMQELSAMLKDL